MLQVLPVCLPVCSSVSYGLRSLKRKSLHAESKINADIFYATKQTGVPILSRMTAYYIATNPAHVCFVYTRI